MGIGRWLALGPALWAVTSSAATWFNPEPEIDTFRRGAAQASAPKEVDPRAAIAALPEAATKIYPTCTNNLKTIFWAQLAVDADLMAIELKRLGVLPGHTRVAVLDTGFDRAGNLDRLASPHFETAKGFDGAGNPDEDKSGHGTMVAGVIGGRDGIGVAPDVELSVYRVINDWSESSSTDNLQTAARRACNAGNSVINMSWGGLWDESGRERDEVREKKFLDEMADRGCLIVKAAGNDSYREDFSTNKLDDAYLRASAVSGAGTLSPFSSIGELSAPGSYVYTFESTTTGVRKATDNDKICTGKRGRLVNGTSFAAPLTTAVAAEIFGVLKATAGEGFACLPGRDQIAVVNRILKASEFLGSISGLRSVLLAERWAKHGEGKVPEISDLKTWLRDEPPAFCAERAASWKPDAVADAVSRTRARLVACPWGADSQAEARNLVQVLTRGHNFELTLRWLPIFEPEFIKKERELFAKIADYEWKVLEKKWAANSAYANVGFGMDFDEALSALPLLAQATSSTTDGRKGLTDRVDSFFKSWDFQERMSRRNLRGSEEDYARIRMLWKLLARQNMAALPYEIIKRWTDDKTELKVASQRLKSREVLVSYRLLADLLDDDDFKAYHARSSDLEWQLFQRLAGTNRLELERVAEDKPDLLHLSFFGDMNNFYTRYLDPFMSRHGNRVKALIDFDSNAPKLDKISAFFVMYFLKGGPTVSEEKQNQLALSALRTVASGNGWNHYASGSWTDWQVADDKISDTALSVLSSAAEKHEKEPGYVDNLRKGYLDLFRDSQSFDFVATQMPNYGPDKTYFWSWLQKRNPFPSKDDFVDLGLKTFLAATQLKADAKYRHGFAVAKALSAAGAFLLHRKDAQEAGGYAFPIGFDPARNRLQPFNLSNDGTACSAESPQMIADLVQSWAEFLLGLKGDERRYSYPAMMPLKAVYDARYLCEALPETGEWRKPLEGVLAEAKSSYDAYGTSNFEVKWSAERLLKRCSYK